MQKSYTQNFFQIYLWRIIAFSSQFVAMFIVSPLLTSNPGIYGIYSICLSLTIFFSYADFGFLGAAQKYASESFARDEREEEIKIMGFVSFILLIFIIPFSIVILFISFDPRILIREMTNPSEIIISSQLLMILSASSLLFIFNRIVSTIVEIRLEGYIFNRIEIVGSFIRIGSVILFFTPEKYDIVGYFLFSQILSMIQLFIFIFIIRKRYRYDLKLLLHSIRYSKIIFKKTKNLAFTALYVTIMAVLYTDIDLVVLGTLTAPEIVAFYQIGLSIFSYLRGIVGILFPPFVSRFNHFIGTRDTEGLKKIFSNVVLFTMPILVVSILTLSLFMQPFITTWVGGYFIPSTILGQFLALSFVFAFIANPSSILLYAHERVKEQYIIITINAILYWVGIFFTYPFLGLFSFALFKFITSFVGAIFYGNYGLNFINLNFVQFSKKFLLPLVIPIAFVVICGLFLPQFLIIEKSPLNLLMVIIVMGGVIMGGIILFFIISRDFRVFTVTIVTELFPFLAKRFKKLIQAMLK